MTTTDGVVAGIDRSHLSRPTPCEGWTVAELLAHMIGQHHGFAVAIERGDAPVAAYEPRPVADPPGLWTQWTDSVTHLTGAIAGSGPGATAVLSELHASHRFPVPMVVGFQVLDTVVHTWDLAVALGGDHRPTPDLIALVNQIALEVPGGASREEPGAAFRPALDAASDDRWDQTLALLGRRPAAPIGGAA